MTRPTETPNRVILHPLVEADPRLTLDDRALVEASRNAYPVVAAGKPRRDAAGLAAGATVAVLLGGITFWSMSAHRTHPAAAPAGVGVAAPLARPAAPLATPAYGQGRATIPLVAPPPLPGALSTTAVAPQASPVMVYDASTPNSVGTPVAMASAPPAAPPASKPMVIAGSGENDQFAQRVGDGDVPVATAQAMANPSRTVTQGTLIPAVLETAIDTDLPGYVRALVSQDVRSFDGSQVLIPRSSRLIGQYKSGLAAGQTRAYVIWSRLIRPDGASVALGSPAVEYGGTSGLAGKVDGHFMKRFGSAVLLSVVGGLGALGSSGTSVVLSGGGSSAASVAATRDSAIPPTIRVAQGQPIRIFTAKDLDFSAVPAVTTAAR